MGHAEPQRGVEQRRWRAGAVRGLLARRGDHRGGHRAGQVGGAGHQYARGVRRAPGRPGAGARAQVLAGRQPAGPRLQGQCYLYLSGEI